MMMPIQAKFMGTVTRLALLQIGFNSECIGSIGKAQGQVFHRSFRDNRMAMATPFSVHDLWNEFKLVFHIEFSLTGEENANKT